MSENTGIDLKAGMLEPSPRFNVGETVVLNKARWPSFFGIAESDLKSLLEPKSPDEDYVSGVVISLRFEKSVGAYVYTLDPDKIFEHNLMLRKFEIGDVVYVKCSEATRMLKKVHPIYIFKEPHAGARLGVVAEIESDIDYSIVFLSVSVLPHLRHAQQVLNQNIAARVEAEIPNPKVQSSKPTKAVRSSDADKVRYDLITPIGLQRLAMRYALGSMKYGDYNWTKGFSFSGLLNHVERHLKAYTLGDRSEDHLAGAAWGIFTMMHFETTNPDLNDLKRYCEDGLAVFNQLEAQFPHTKAGN